MATRRGRIDTRALGLDVAAELARFLTGRENLHYGIWEPGVEVCAANLRQAQEAYSKRLFELIAPPSIRILDIGGGCGETARALTDLGHKVEIIVPSRVMADRCKANTGGAVPVHLMRFEEFESAARFDLCLFSESFQYIPVAAALAKAGSCLAEGGEILVADCFRSEKFFSEFTDVGIVGGGHGEAAFREALSVSGFEVVFEEDITDAVAPSVDLEQQLFNLLGFMAERFNEDFSLAFPLRHRLLRFGLRFLLNRRRLGRLERRLFGDFKNASLFRRYNRYLVVKLKPSLTR